MPSSESSDSVPVLRVATLAPSKTPEPSGISTDLTTLVVSAVFPEPYKRPVESGQDLPAGRFWGGTPTGLFSFSGLEPNLGMSPPAAPTTGLSWSNVCISSLFLKLTLDLSLARIPASS